MAATSAVQLVEWMALKKVAEMVDAKVASMVDKLVVVLVDEMAVLRVGWSDSMMVVERVVSTVLLSAELMVAQTAGRMVDVTVD